MSYLKKYQWELIPKSLPMVRRNCPKCNENELIIQIACKYLIELRIDKLLSDKLGISRSKIKNMNKEGLIFIKDNKSSLNIKVKYRIEIHVLNLAENIEILEAIE